MTLAALNYLSKLANCIVTILLLHHNYHEHHATATRQVHNKSSVTCLAVKSSLA